MGVTEIVIATTAAISLAATAVGTGMSYYSQQQQASNAQAVANYNAAIMQQNAQVELQMAQYQAQQNAAIANAQAQAQMNNAAALEQQAAAAEAQGREQAARTRANNEAMLATQRAKYAKAGVVNEGTPLVVLAKSAEIGELSVQDVAYQAELERNSKLYAADLQKYESGFSLIAAQQAEYQGLAASAGYDIAMNEAELAKMQGASDAAKYQMGANASLISGISSAAGQVGNYAYNTKPYSAVS